MAVRLLYIYVAALYFLRFVSPSSFCPKESNLFLYALQSQCSSALSINPPLQVDGNFIDRALRLDKMVGYKSIFFYASWCPFSSNMEPTFEALSFMFPQIEHLMIEQSSALPSALSIYRIHSFPSILLVNQTSSMQYHGAKRLPSLVQFYEKTTGFEPVQHHESNSNQRMGYKAGEGSIFQQMNTLPLNEILRKEPYLVFSILFLCLKAMLIIFSVVSSKLRFFWVSYVLPHFNLEVVGERSQIMGRALHMVDVSGVWAKLKRCKIRNLREGAMNARVWASSLAAVSLGESSSPSYNRLN